MRNALRKKRIQQSQQAGSAAFPPAFPTAKIVCPFEKSMQNGHIEIELPAAMAVGTKESM
jgi:hypothetical protein